MHTDNTSRPVIGLGALGGTIAMKPAKPGEAVSPDLDAEDLIGAVPGLGEIAEIRAESLCNVSSPELAMTHVLSALRFANQQVDQGAAGVVLTHGTDTLEETAFLLDLLWDRAEPIVITGAMRSPNLPGADGPANLMTAVTAACHPDLRNLGVLVAFNDEIHAARAVTKSHSTSTATFKSPTWGPIARVNESRVDVGFVPRSRHAALPAPDETAIRIPILEAGLADDGHFLEALADAGAKAIVLAASGGGHVSEASARRLAGIVERGIPVIFATKTGAGRTLESSYGYPGSESDLLAKGLIGAGYLSPRKARLLAHVVLSSGAGPDELAAAVHTYG